MRKTIAVVAAVAVMLVIPVAAQAYATRGASRTEQTAIAHDAKLTQACGYTGRRGHLGRFRVAFYRRQGVLYRWASTTWSVPGTDGCVLVFVNVAGDTFRSTLTQRHAVVTWLPFTYGSSPYEDPSYLDQEWRHLSLPTGPPNWLALGRALS